MNNIDKFRFFIHDDVFDIQNINKEFLSMFKSLTEIPRMLKANTFYNKEVFNTLLELYKEDDSYTFTSKKTILKNLVFEFQSKIKDCNLFTIIFNNEHSNIIHFNAPFINFNAVNNINIVLNTTINEDYKFVLIKNGIVELIEVKFSNSAEDIWKFINQNLQKRNYCFNPKHGNNSKKFIPNKNEIVSQLLCSDEDAQLLLDNAIFDLRIKNFHFNFDFNHNTYIVFPYDGNIPQNTFHAYHLDKNKWNEVPNSIQNYFKFLHEKNNQTKRV